MMDFINALFGFNAAVINRGRVAWMRVVVRSILVLLVLLLVGSLMNYFDWKGFNLFVAFASGVAGILLGLRPEGLIYSAELGIFAGAASQPQTIRKEVRNFLELYARTAAKVLFWVSGAFFILGTISIKENPWAVLGVLAAITVIFSYVIGFDVKFAIARRVIYAYTCFMLVMLILSLIPRYQWIRYTGYDVKGILASTEAEIGVSKIEKAEEARLEGAKKTFLEGIERKVEKGGLKSLSKEDLELYQKLEKERDERSIPKQVSALFEQKKAEAKSTPPPAPLPPVPDRIAVLPTAPYRPPPVVTPKRFPVLEWELSENIPYLAPTRQRVRVFFSKNYREVVIEVKYGATTIYEGFQEGSERGVFEGHWTIQSPSYPDGYGKFYLKFDTRDRDQSWEYARGWRIINGKQSELTLKKVILLRDHE